MVLNGYEIRMFVKFENLHAFVVIAPSDEFHSGLFKFVDISEIHFVAMPVTFIDRLNIAIEFF